MADKAQNPSDLDFLRELPQAIGMAVRDAMLAQLFTQQAKPEFLAETLRLFDNVSRGGFNQPSVESALVQFLQAFDTPDWTNNLPPTPPRPGETTNKDVSGRPFLDPGYQGAPHEDPALISGWSEFMAAGVKLPVPPDVGPLLNPEGPDPEFAALEPGEMPKPRNPYPGQRGTDWSKQWGPLVSPFGDQEVFPDWQEPPIPFARDRNEEGDSLNKEFKRKQRRSGSEDGRATDLPLGVIPSPDADERPEGYGLAGDSGNLPPPAQMHVPPERPYDVRQSHEDFPPQSILPQAFLDRHQGFPPNAPLKGFLDAFSLPGNAAEPPTFLPVPGTAKELHGEDDAEKEEKWKDLEDSLEELAAALKENTKAREAEAKSSGETSASGGPRNRYGPHVKPASSERPRSDTKPSSEAGALPAGDLVKKLLTGLL